MDRRTLIVSSLATLGAAAAARAQTTSRSLPPAAPSGSLPPPPPPPPAEAPPPPSTTPRYPAERSRAETYSEDEIVNSVSDFMGVTAESAGAAVERIFEKNGRPTAYIAGTEG